LKLEIVATEVREWPVPKNGFASAQWFRRAGAG